MPGRTCRTKLQIDMAAKQRMRIASEKHSQNVTARGNVPKSMVSVNRDRSRSFLYLQQDDTKRPKLRRPSEMFVLF